LPMPRMSGAVRTVEAFVLVPLEPPDGRVQLLQDAGLVAADHQFGAVP
jgi:hypothetical protein